MKPGMFKVRIVLLLSICVTTLFSQKTSISYETNGKTESLTSKNPFAKFFGEWTLKNDDWTHNWGQGTETIKIPGHHTVSTGINTQNSLLSIIDGPKPNGHIFWSYNPNTKEVYHLSSFGNIRAGNGQGTIDEEGNLKLKLFFEGEPKGTYRKYSYTWVNDDEYELKSVQFGENDQPTGLFYGGVFVRITDSSNDKNKLEASINKILSVLDDNDITTDEKLTVYADDVVHMAPNNPAITNKEDLGKYLAEQKKHGYSDMKHHIVEVDAFDNTILMRGKVIGVFYPSNGDNPINFETKNLFVFKRVNNDLKISKVIYNMSPKISKE